MSDCFDHAADAGDSLIRSSMYENGDDGDYYYCDSGVELKAKVIVTSERAKLLEFGEGFEVVRRWVPNSQIRWIREDRVTVTNWIFNKLGLQILRR